MNEIGCCITYIPTLAPDANIPRHQDKTKCRTITGVIVRCLNSEKEPTFVSVISSIHLSLFLSPDQQSGIHCLVISAIQLLTLNNLDGT